MAVLHQVWEDAGQSALSYGLPKSVGGMWKNPLTNNSNPVFYKLQMYFLPVMGKCLDPEALAVAEGHVNQSVLLSLDAYSMHYFLSKTQSNHT